MYTILFQLWRVRPPVCQYYIPPASFQFPHPIYIEIWLVTLHWWMTWTNWGCHMPQGKLGKGLWKMLWRDHRVRVVHWWRQDTWAPAGWGVGSPLAKKSGLCWLGIDTYQWCSGNAMWINWIVLLFEPQLYILTLVEHNNMSGNQQEGQSMSSHSGEPNNLSLSGLGLERKLFHGPMCGQLLCPGQPWQIWAHWGRGFPVPNRG